jgi:uncharacterized protein YceH (UPF0502 family)
MRPSLQLTAEESRVLGCLIEKAITTPDQYPLSLKALSAACNQKSSREPIVDWSESKVESILRSLMGRRLVMEQRGFGSRVPHYQHRFCNTEFSQYQFSAQQLAVLCVLLLRGPQTPGELRSRTQRMAEFADVVEVERVLEHLAADFGEPLVERLEREPGKRESRYQELLTQSPQASADLNLDVNTPVIMDRVEAEKRIVILQQQIILMQQEIDSLKQEYLNN